MAKYIRLCRQPNKPRLSVLPSYLISEEESNGGNAFSLSDLNQYVCLPRVRNSLSSKLLPKKTQDMHSLSEKTREGGKATAATGTARRFANPNYFGRIAGSSGNRKSR